MQHKKSTITKLSQEKMNFNPLKIIRTKKYVKMVVSLGEQKFLLLNKLNKEMDEYFMF